MIFSHPSSFSISVCSKCFLCVSHSFVELWNPVREPCTDLSLRRPFSQRKPDLWLISRSTRRNWTDQFVSLRALCPSVHPLLVILLPSSPPFFSLPSSEIVFLTSVGPSLFPAIKTGPGGRRCLENVVIIAQTHTYTHRQGPLSSSLVNDAPNLARSRNESKVSSHHHHHHHHSSAGPWLSPSHIICSRENIIFFCQASFSLPLFSLLLTCAVILSFHILLHLYLFCSHCKLPLVSFFFPHFSLCVCLLLFLLNTRSLPTFLFFFHGQTGL